jgi:hypothetical protein
LCHVRVVYSMKGGCSSKVGLRIGVGFSDPGRPSAGGNTRLDAAQAMSPASVRSAHFVLWKP